MRWSLVILVAFAALPVWISSAHAVPAGRARTEALIAAFKKVKVDGKAQKTVNDRTFTELDDFFDFGTLTAKPIEPIADKLNAKELAKFKTTFRELIRLIAYPNAGDLFRKAKLTLQPEMKKAEVVAVPLILRVEEEDLDLAIEFCWANVQGKLRIVDVLFDGDSLIKDYQNQIGKIFAKSGARGLFKALDERRAELEKNK
jgi:ABC-type transporter MlaC component